MKTILSIVCCILSVGILRAETSKKEFSKSYEKKGIQELIVSSRSGQMEIEQSEEDHIDISAVLAVTAKNGSKADELLEFIQVKDVVAESFVNIETVFGKDMTFKQLLSGVGIQIDYKIRLPKGVKLRLVMTEGNIFVNEFDGEINLDIKTGNFKGGSLLGGPLYIRQTNGNFDVTQVSEMTGEFKNCELKIENGEEVTLVTDNCKGYLESIAKLNIKSSGGEMKLGQIESLSGTSSSTKYEIQDIGNELKMDMRLGEINVRNVHFAFSTVDITGTYSKVGLTFMEGAGYQLELKHTKSVRMDIPKSFKLTELPTSERNVFVKTGFIGNKKYQGKVFLNLRNGNMYIQ